ncbi:hypothetical protein ACEN33_07040 [Ruoffia sp. FAM 24228]|uniref:hypothetical protein n=1 Tax=unclassified Ruoffia TaxID=2862149 RepID=UPI003889E3AB
MVHLYQVHNLEKASFGDIALTGINKQTALDILLEEKVVAMGRGGDGITAMSD